MSRKKQQEGSMKTLRDLLSQPSNKKCLECDQRGPTYVDITIGSFVCTSCGGILRGLNPPHRVKSISMTNFTNAETSFMESRGNEWCRAVYLAKYDEQSNARPESKSDTTKLKQFMELKYEQKRWYESPTQQRKLMESVAARMKKNNDKAKTSAKSAPSKSQTKPAAAPVKQSATNLLDGLSFPSQPVVSQNVVPNQNSGTFDGFADFDRAFAELSTSQNNTASQGDPFAAFQVSAQPISFTNAAAKPSSVPPAATENKTADKYAALLDLDLTYNKTDNSASKNEPFFSMSGNGMMAPAVSQPTSMAPFSGMSNQPIQNNAFAANSATPGYNQPAPTSNYGTAANWNAPFATYAQHSSNPPPVASATNPFFSSTPAPAQSWPMQPGPNAASNNQAGFSSTNPFNIGGSSVPAGYAFNMTQASNPPQNSSNPFLFS